MTDFIDHRPGLAKRQSCAFQANKLGMTEGTVLFSIGPFPARPVSAVSTPEAPGIPRLAIGSPFVILPYRAGPVISRQLAAVIALICICLQLAVCFW